MLSAHKQALLVFVLAAIVGAVLPLMLAASVQLQWITPEGVRPYLGPVLALAVVAFAPAIILQIEYAQALRGADFNLLREETLSFGQFLDSLRRCPAPLVASSLILASVSMALSLLGGTPNWSATQPLTVQIARSIMLFQAPFALFALPILISGYRVPGSFALRIQPNANDA